MPAAAWLGDAAARDVVGSLVAAGGTPRFVGGCVRDTLLGRPVGDLDIATPLRPLEVLSALRAAGIKAVPTGLDHGTVTAVVRHGDEIRSFEITTLRVDVETDGRHAVVAFTDDWEGDATRRDFTMNALSLEPDGTLHDYFGGVADALAGRVRFVGDPCTRLEEDVLRLLRFFRFVAHYARTPPDPEALAACRAYAPRLKSLSGERIRAELLKLLAAPDPVPAWRLMAETGTAGMILGWPGDVDRLAALTRLEARPDPVRRLAALLHGRTAPTEALAERIRLSNSEGERLAALVAQSEAVAPDMQIPDLHRLSYRVGRERAEDLVLLAWSAAPAEPRFEALLVEARRWQPPRFPLQGRDVLALGVPPGRVVGRLLAEVEDWWITGNFTADRDACLETAKRLSELR